MLYIMAVIGILLITGGLIVCRKSRMRTKQKKRKLAVKSVMKQKKG
ncbi:MAG: hypothetical protein K2K89_14035 [Ruminococcus sp.]|nr:hypothetical protein [Ruminococcus sp.]